MRAHDIVSTDFIVTAEVTVNNGLIGLRDIATTDMIPVVTGKTIGENLRAYRLGQLGKNGKRLTQAELAESVGVSQGRISDIERGRYESLDLATLLALAKRQSLSVDALIAGYDPDYDAIVSTRGTGTAKGDLPKHEAAHQARLLERRTAALARLVKDVQEVTAKLIKSYPVIQDDLAPEEDRGPSTQTAGTHSSPRRRRG